MKPRLDERSFLFLRAKVEGMTMPEKLHRLAQLCDFDEWFEVAERWLSEECRSSKFDKLSS